MDPGIIILFSGEAMLQQVIAVSGGVVPTPGPGATALETIKDWFISVVARHVNCTMRDLTPALHNNPPPVCINTTVWSL